MNGCRLKMEELEDKKKTRYRFTVNRKLSK